MADLATAAGSEFATDAELTDLAADLPDLAADLTNLTADLPDLAADLTNLANLTPDLADLSDLTTNLPDLAADLPYLPDLTTDLSNLADLLTPAGGDLGWPAVSADIATGGRQNRDGWQRKEPGCAGTNRWSAWKYCDSPADTSDAANTTDAAYPADSANLTNLAANLPSDLAANLPDLATNLTADLAANLTTDLAPNLTTDLATAIAVNDKVPKGPADEPQTRVVRRRCRHAGGHEAAVALLIWSGRLHHGRLCVQSA